MARYFELVEGSSSKFWEISIKGTAVLTRYGRIGTAGQTTEKDEGSPEKATKLFEKLVAEKTKKGYVESGAGAAEEKPAKADKKGGASEEAALPVPATEYDAAIARIVARATKAGVKLNKGASEEAIRACEKKLRHTLPAEVRAFYRHHDGGPDDSIDGRELLSLKRIAAEWKVWCELLDSGDFEGNESSPAAGVQNRWWTWEWIPVTYDGGGNHHVLDLAPEKGGTYGQIISFWHDSDDRELVGKGFLAWLEKAKWGEAE